MNNLRKMEGIVMLDISLPSLTKILYNSIPFALSNFHLLPNLHEINLSNVGISCRILIQFSINCPLLEKVTWNNIHGQYSGFKLDGYCMESAKNLKEIVMDDSEFHCSQRENDKMSNLEEEEEHRDKFIFCRCSNTVERVSIRNAKCTIDYYDTTKVVPQNALIKFIRNAPTSLRWFRSDLNQENMDILRKERPDIELLN